MKHILAAVDFTETSDNAAIYAADLAKALGAHLTLFHSYSVPVPAGDTSVILISPEEFHRVSKRSCSSLAKKIEKRNGIIPAIKLEAGFAVEEISSAAKKLRADLVVMGMKDDGKFSEIFIGSTSTSVISRAEVPVMVVPSGITFSPYKNIVFTCDYAKTSSVAYLNVLKNIAQKFNSRLFIVNFISSDTKINKDEKKETMKLEMKLEGLIHSFYFPVSDNIVNGISTFIEVHGGDLVVMTHHRHSLFYRMFHENKTKTMSFKTRIPLLNLADPTT